MIFVGILGIITAVEFPPPLNWYDGTLGFQEWIEPFNEDFVSAEVAASLCIFGVLSILGEIKSQKVILHFGFF